MRDFEPQEFLKQGAIFADGNGNYLAATGPFESSQEPLAHGPSFFAPDYLLEEPKPWWVPSRWHLFGAAQLRQTLEPLTDSDMVSWDWRPPAFEEFSGQFAQIKKTIESGELQKIVAFTHEASRKRPEAADLAKALGNLLADSQDLYPYGLWNRSFKGVLGLTPEKLFHRKGSRLLTMALAGTSAEPGQLIVDPKERLEHQLVVDALVERLSNLGTVKTSETYEWNLGSLFHLRTDIEVDQKTRPTFLQTCEMLHPTPALGGYPPKPAFSWHASHRFNHGDFGAPFGIHWPEKDWYQCLVAIRNLRWDGQQSWISSGCGVLAQSQLEKEWKELKLKRESVKRVLDCH